MERETCEGMEVYFHIVLSSVLDGYSSYGAIG
jgi:hypothetical protein